MTFGTVEQFRRKYDNTPATVVGRMNWSMRRWGYVVGRPLIPSGGLGSFWLLAAPLSASHRFLTTGGVRWTHGLSPQIEFTFSGFRLFGDSTRTSPYDISHACSHLCEDRIFGNPGRTIYQYRSTVYFFTKTYRNLFSFLNSTFIYNFLTWAFSLCIPHIFGIFISWKLMYNK